MKAPFNTLTISDVQKLRKERSGIPDEESSIIYDHTKAEILSAQIHLKSLYKSGVTLPFTERILLLNDIH